MIGKPVLLTSAILLASTAWTQWTVVNLHPSGASTSFAESVEDGKQVGTVRVDGNNHAAMWSGSAASFVDINPAGSTTSSAHGTSGNQQVGSATSSHAYLWSGNAGSGIDLNPVGASASTAAAIDGGQQAGVATIGGISQAGMWSGTAASWVSLHPVGSEQSHIHGIGGGQQVGFAYFFGFRQASLWSGSAGSRISLHPGGSTDSIAYGVHNGRQVGYAVTLGQQKASIWSGNIGSWKSLHPTGSASSTAYGIYGDYQCGWANSAGVNRAAIWSGTANSRVDLHAFVPAGFTASRAADVWQSSENLYVVGEGTDDNTMRREALIWISRLLPPLSLSVTRGILTGGNQQSLVASDDDRITLRPGIVFSTQQAPVEIRFDATANTANPNGLSFSIESSASFGSAQQSILLWNYQTQGYETLNTQSVTLEDDVYRVTVTTNASRFIEQNTLAMRAAVSIRAVGPSFAYPWTYCLDKAWWNLPG